MAHLKNYFQLVFLIYTLWETCAWWASSNAIVFCWFFYFNFNWLTSRIIFNLSSLFLLCERLVLDGPVLMLLFFFFLFFFPWLELAHLKFYLKVVIVFLKIFSFVSIYCQLVDQSTHSTFSINPHLASLFYCLFCFC